MTRVGHCPHCGAFPVQFIKAEDGTDLRFAGGHLVEALEAVSRCSRAMRALSVPTAVMVRDALDRALSGPEGRAEGQSPAGRPLTVTDQPKADSDPAVDLLRATVNRLMVERDALADALRRIAGGDIDDRSLVTNADVLLAYQRVASAALAQLDSVAPPLTPND